jgi:ATP-dependent DNA helicase RecQ
LATFLSTSVNDVVRKLKHMHQMEIVDYDPQKDKPQLLFLTARADAARLPLDRKKLEERYKVQAEKIDKIIHYTTHSYRCRTQLLQEYFGEVTDDRCGVCDVCVQQKANGDTEFSEIKNIKQKIRNLLNDTPLIPQQISQQIGGKEDMISETIRMMLDGQELQYDKAGRLVLKK